MGYNPDTDDIHKYFAARGSVYAGYRLGRRVVVYPILSAFLALALKFPFEEGTGYVTGCFLAAAFAVLVFEGLLRQLR